MSFIVKTHHVTLTKAIKDYAKEKLANLDKFFNNIQETVVELVCNETSDINKSHTAIVIVRASGTVVKAEQKSKDMYASIDGVLEKITVQLKKHKDKLRSPKRESTKQAAAAPEIKEKKKKIKASTSKSLYVAKPIATEDAAAILEEKSLPFLVFKNMETDTVNVLYVDEKKQLALIETD